MAKICPKCNVYVEDMIRYCPKCNGYVQTGNEESSANNVENIERKSRINKIKKSVFSVMLIIVLVFVGVTLYHTVFDDTYETPIKKFYSGINKADVLLVLEAYPPFVRESFKTEIKQAIKTVKDDDITGMNFKIKEKKPIDDKDLKLQESIYKQQYKVDIKITEGFSLKGIASLKRIGFGESKELEHKVIRIGNRWYILE